MLTLTFCTQIRSLLQVLAILGGIVLFGTVLEAQSKLGVCVVITGDVHKARATFRCYFPGRPAYPCNLSYLTGCHLCLICPCNIGIIMYSRESYNDKQKGKESKSSDASAKSKGPPIVMSPLTEVSVDKV